MIPPYEPSGIVDNCGEISEMKNQDDPAYHWTQKGRFHNGILPLFPLLFEVFDLAQFLGIRPT